MLYPRLMLGEKNGALEDAVLVTNFKDVDPSNESKVVRAMVLQAQVNCAPCITQKNISNLFRHCLLWEIWSML